MGDSWEASTSAAEALCAHEPNEPLTSLRSERSAERRLPRRSSCRVGTKPGHATLALRATPWQDLTPGRLRRRRLRRVNLSPGEREQRSLRCWEFDGSSRRRRASNVRAVRLPNQSANGLPLPGGEGGVRGPLTHRRTVPPSYRPTVPLAVHGKRPRPLRTPSAPMNLGASRPDPNRRCVLERTWIKIMIKIMIKRRMRRSLRAQVQGKRPTVPPSVHASLRGISSRGAPAPALFPRARIVCR